MNETIGVKGGHNDYRRVMTITKKQKEKLKKYQEEKEIKELEKEVKRKQRYTLIKTLPIVIAGQTIKELLEPREKQKLKEEKFIVEENKKIEEPKTRKVVIVLKDGTKQVIEVPISKEITKEYIEDIEKQTTEITKDKPKEEPTKEEKQEPIKQEPTKQEPTKQETKEEKFIVEEKKQEEKQNPIKEESKEKNNIDKDYTVLTEKQKDKLQKLQARKIIDVYERQLKDIRYELRSLIIEYNTLVSEEEKIIKSKEEEKILDKLNEIINKLEQLKEKIKIDNLDKYDDNYIYTLIEGYLEEFKDKQIIKEIKDSPLYILISEKLDEFDKKKESFKNKIDDKKEILKLKENKLDELKDKYLKIEELDSNLNNFYREQELLLKEMEYKIDNAVTITEKVEVQVEYMNFQASALLRRLSLLMFVPGKKGAMALAAMTAMYLNMARNMLAPKTSTKKYTEVVVTDYSRDIELNIKKLDQVSSDLSKSSKSIDNLISKIKEEFSEYIGVIPECDELLSNLDKVKSNIKEKEYELEKIKIKQEKELARNNAKLLMR